MNITDIIQMSMYPSIFIQYLLDINPLLRTRDKNTVAIHGLSQLKSGDIQK